MAIDGNQLATFGDVRRDILDTIRDIKSKALTPNEGMAVFAGYKVLNDNIQAEINTAKMALATKNEAHSFGRVVGMGRKFIGNDAGQEA